MYNPIQRQRSLKKLHFCIANFVQTKQEASTLKITQQQLQAKIQIKQKKSESNKTYVFPRKFCHKEIYSNQPEIIDLHQPYQAQAEKENIEVRNKPKIKLGRTKPQKRIQTQYYEKGFEDYRTKRHQHMINSNKTQPLQEIKLNNNLTSNLKQKLKTQSCHKKQESILQKSTNKFQNQLFLQKLSKEKQGSQSKSKLNMLTKSYINMKSSLKNSTSKTTVNCAITNNINNIRTTNDYKFMPPSIINLNNTLNHKTNNNNFTTKLSINKVNYRANDQNRDRIASYDRKYAKFK